MTTLSMHSKDNHLTHHFNCSVKELVVRMAARPNILDSVERLEISNE